jgi:hypothetical protein
MTTESRPLHEEVLGALKDFLEAQDALDNHELIGVNAEDYFIVLRRRNAARKDLDSAIAKLEAALPLQPVAWMWEFTDPHTGERRQEARKNKPREYELLPGELVTPLYASPASLPQQEGEAIPKVLFDGYYVWDEGLTDSAKKRTSPENVADVLDAVVRLMRKEKGTPHA